MKPNRISQGAIPKTSTRKTPEDETTKPLIATVRGSEKLKSKSKEVNPAVIEIIDKQRPIKTLDGLNRCNENSISTISSEQIRSSGSTRPWIKVPCNDAGGYNRTSSKTGQSRPEDSRLSESNYQERILSVPVCIESEAATSFDQADQSKMQQDKQASQEIDDTAHKRSQLRNPKFMGSQWKQPCSVAAGAPPRYTGIRPSTIKQIARMSKTRQKLFLTQNPRRRHCLINLNLLRTKEISKDKELKTFSKLVKTSGNLSNDEKIEHHDPILCETIDLENPLNLDIQGLNYKNTYEGDEQNIQNIQLYRSLGRHMDRKPVQTEIRDKVEDDLQNERIAKPKNKKRIENEIKLRRQHFKDLYLGKNARTETNEKKAEKAEEAEKEIMGTTVALQTFDNDVKPIDDGIVQAVKGEQVDTKFFLKALHEEGDTRDSISDLKKTPEQIVPFYFDHFLKLNGYKPNYNFRTQTEIRDGPELERLQVKALIPEVLEKLEKWENQRRKTMEDNIARYPKMYENVKF